MTLPQTKRIYMDHNATTPVEPRVLRAMLPYFSELFGNAASQTHTYGMEASDAVEAARDQLAKVIGAQPAEIIFTSGGTESDNIALKGTLAATPDRRHIITDAVEHKAILDTAERLGKDGCDITVLPVDKTGRVDPASVADAIRDDTLVVSIMAANNEVGTINPIKEIGEAIKAKNPSVYFHTDAVQAFGKIPIDVNAMKIDMLSASGHKIYGPKGIGLLYVRSRSPRVRAKGVIDGGGHERGLRSGTLNVPGIVGFGAAAKIAADEMQQTADHDRTLRDRLKEIIFNGLNEVYLNGHPTERLPNTVNIAFNFVEGESLMLKLPYLAVSAGSACTSASLKSSFVLEAMGVPEGLSHTALRFSLGRSNSADDVERVGVDLIAAVKVLRELSPFH